MSPSIELIFFWFLFSGYFRSADPRVVSIVSGDCTHSFSALFYVITESLYRCVNAVFNAGKSSFPLFFWHISVSMSSLGCKALRMVISFLVLLSICLRSSLVHFKIGPEYLSSWTAQVFIFFISFLLYSFLSSRFLVFSRYSFLTLSFLFTCLMVSVFNTPKYL